VKKQLCQTFDAATARDPFRDKRFRAFPRHRDRNRNRDRIRVLNHWFSLIHLHPTWHTVMCMDIYMYVTYWLLWFLYDYYCVLMCQGQSLIGLLIAHPIPFYFYRALNSKVVESQAFGWFLFVHCVLFFLRRLNTPNCGVMHCQLITVINDTVWLL